MEEHKSSVRIHDDPIHLTLEGFNEKFSQRYGSVTSVEFQKFVHNEGLDQVPSNYSAYFTMPTQNLVIVFAGDGHPSLAPAYKLLISAGAQAATRKCLVCYRTEKGETDVFELTLSNSLAAN